MQEYEMKTTTIFNNTIQVKLPIGFQDMEKIGL